MPALHDELTADQLQLLAAALRKLRSELTAVIESSRAGAKPVELDQPIGRLSRIDAIAQQQLAKSNRKGQQLRLGQVMAALSLLDETPEEYGYCAQCEEPIAFRRLQAKPESRFCLDCQGTREKRS